MTRISVPAATIVAAAITLSLLLALPARTITTAYINDVLIFLDGAQRVAFGQVPNRDFHTALGPLVYYLPAVGLWLSGRMGGALPVGMGVLILVLTPVLAYVVTSRLRPVLGVTFALFLLLILATPVNLGDPLSSLSFAMFYNRIGWFALGLLAVLHLEPTSGGKAIPWLDAGAAALLMLVTIYTKITYAPVALAFVLLGLLNNRQRFSAAVAIGLIAACGVLVELVWGGTAGHVNDLLATAKVSGDRSLRAIIQAGLNNLPDLLVAAVLAVWALCCRPRLQDILFYGLCFGGGVLILSQNAHSWGIITLFAAAAVAGETIIRSGSARALSGAALLFLLLALPPIARHTIAFVTHSALAFADFGAPLPLPRFQEVRFGRLWSPGDNGFSELYIGTFAEGAAMLEQRKPAPEQVLVLDFANPFSAGLNLAPPTGDLSWMHWGRNISAAHHPEPEQLFAGAAVVMIPKIGINSAQLSEIYEPYLSANWQLVRNTRTWKLFVPRTTP